MCPEAKIYYPEEVRLEEIQQILGAVGGKVIEVTEGKVKKILEQTVSEADEKESAKLLYLRIKSVVIEAEEQKKANIEKSRSTESIFGRDYKTATEWIPYDKNDIQLVIESLDLGRGYEREELAIILTRKQGAKDQMPQAIATYNFQGNGIFTEGDMYGNPIKKGSNDFDEIEKIVTAVENIVLSAKNSTMQIPQQPK